MWEEGPRCPSRLLSHAAFVCSSPARRRLELVPMPLVGVHTLDAADPGTGPRMGCAESLGLRLGRATYLGGQRCPVLQHQSQPPGSHV